jgi:hypothetical protein
MKTNYQQIEENPLGMHYLEILEKNKPEDYDEAKVKEAVKKGLTKRIMHSESELKKMEEEFNIKRNEYNRRIGALREKGAILEKEGLKKYQESFYDR